MFGDRWTSEYYDVMEFYYWEPQHLGKIKNPKSRYNNQYKSLEHIRNMEVSLNHMFNVFFRLAPSNFVNSLVNVTCDTKVKDKFLMQGRYNVREFSQLVQPDLLFTSSSANFSIEMKIEAKSSIEQVYKYALLNWLEQQHSGVNRKSILLYIGKGNFKNLWSEKFNNPQEVVKAAIDFDISKLQLRANKVENVKINWDEVRSILSNTIIGYCNYSDLNHLLNNHCNKQSSETELKLFDGLCFEIKERGLV